jgi:hypothetical protein
MIYRINLVIILALSSYSLALAMENKPDTIEVINFGQYTTHTPSLMIILVLSNHKALGQFLFCQQSFDGDLDAFNRFFALYKPIREKYKLEILDI